MAEPSTIEDTFQALCRALDETPEDARAKFLTKLVLVLCDELDHTPAVLAAIERAQRNP